MLNDRPRLRQGILVAVLAVAAVGVGYQLLRGGEDPIDEVPDDPKLASSWACRECGEVYTLTPRELVEFQRRGTSDFTFAGTDGHRPTGEEQELTSARQLILQCAECGKLAVRRAATCTQCRTPFARTVKGKPARCPNCGWDPGTRMPPKRKRMPHGARRP